MLYWMTSNRRTRFNFALERAIEWSRRLTKPLLVLEGLRFDYPWASERMHHFVIGGMGANRDAFEKAGVTYYPYVERRPGEARGLLETLAASACVVVGDDYPAFFLPHLTAAGGRVLDRHGVPFEVVDSNGIQPMRATERVFSTAHSFRRHLQKTIVPHLRDFPRSLPLRGYGMGVASVPSSVSRRWPAATASLLDGSSLSTFALANDVAPTMLPGGSREGEARLMTFVRQRLHHYSEERSHPDSDAQSGLSPYLHFGHLASHQVFQAVAREVGWDLDNLGTITNGARSGFWGMGENAEAFIDQLVTWRELGFNMCTHHRDYKRYTSLPGWAKETLAEHASDPRQHCYDLAQFEAADTHDELWNAAQRQLLEEGIIHNYMRMLWGKKILHWSRSPQVALEIMLHLNDKYALDGRDPNSYSGIFWVLGRYDRPWGPKRAIFGSVRYMASENTRRKLRLVRYLERYGARRGQLSLLSE